MDQNAGAFREEITTSPIGITLGGFAAGLIVGLLVPASRFERERIGPVRDAVLLRARRAGREALSTAAASAFATVQSSNGR